MKVELTAKFVKLNYKQQSISQTMLFFFCYQTT